MQSLHGSVNGLLDDHHPETGGFTSRSMTIDYVEEACVEKLRVMLENVSYERRTLKEILFVRLSFLPLSNKRLLVCDGFPICV